MNRNRRDNNKGPIDPRALIARLSTASQQLLQREIIAPLLPRGKIRTRLSGLIYEFRLQGDFVGWGRFRPLNEREATLIAEAQPWERGGYLELFPTLRMLLLWPDPRPEQPGTWLALPYNDSDARQRFALPMEPLPVYLCDPAYGADRFERIIARVDGKTLWFDGPDALADPTHAERLRDAAAHSENDQQDLSGLAGSERLALLFWQLRQLDIAQEPLRRQQAAAERHRRAVEEQRQAEARRELQRRNRQEQRAFVRQEYEQGQLETRLRHALNKADAVLHSYSEQSGYNGGPNTLVVEWSERGQTYRYRSVVDANLAVVSSGICLSGLDHEFDLTSLVNVITDQDY